MALLQEQGLSPEALEELLSKQKKEVMETFKRSMLAGSDILDQPKGQEVLARMKKEFK